jgi:hypothetical protein
MRKGIIGVDQREYCLQSLIIVLCVVRFWFLANEDMVLRNRENLFCSLKDVGWNKNVAHTLVKKCINSCVDFQTTLEA